MKRVTKKWLLLPIIAVGGVLIASLLLGTKAAHADFNANYLMDDYTFENTGTMNPGQIDSFLNAFPNSCISSNPNGNGNPGFNTPDPTGWSSSEPNNHGYTFGGNVTAGQAIYDAARIYNLNPEVLLATLQKEQSLVTGDSGGCHYTNQSPGSACDRSIYGTVGGCVFIGMSYACPGSCDASYNGFSLQLLAGAWLLRFAEERSKGMTTGYPGHDPSDENISYYGAMVGQAYTLSDGNTITAQTGATASLYYYTPFESGNEDFETIFQSWFGPTTGEGYELVIASNCSSACPQYVVYGTIKQYVTGVAKAAWGLPDQPQLMDPNVLNSYSTGPNLGILATLNTSSIKTIYFMDNGHSYRIPWPSMMDTWNLNGQVVSDVSPGLFTLPASGGDLSNVIQDPSSSTTFYMMDGANNNGQTVIRPYANNTIRQAWEGNLNYVPISSNYFSTINSAIGSTLTTTTASCDGTNFQVVNGGKYIESAAIGALFPAIQSVSVATLNRLPTFGNMTNLVQSTSSPTVYLVDNSTLRQIPWPNALNAWSAGGEAVTQVNDAYISSFTAGSSISSYLAEDGSSNYYVISAGTKYPVPTNLVGAYTNAMSTISVSNNLISIFPTGGSVTGFVQGAGQPSVYLLDNSGKLHHLPNPTVAGLWGAYSTGISQFANYIVSGFSTAADAQTYVSDGTNNYVVDVGKLSLVSSTVATDWGLSTPQTYSDGTLSRLTSTSALTDQLYDGSGTYYYIKGGTAYSTTDPNVAGAWGLRGAPVHNGSLVFSSMPIHGLSVFVQSSTNSSNYYIVDNGGNWYQIPSQLYSDIVNSITPIAILNPTYAPNTITNWASVVVDNNGSYYVIDGSTKRFLPSGVIRDQWTNNETHTDQSVDSYFLNLLPTGANMERAVQGSGPSVYSVSNEVKQHILYPSVYSQYYAPSTSVTDSLLNSLSTGSDITS